jgi:hypothetical protein
MVRFDVRSRMLPIVFAVFGCAALLLARPLPAAAVKIGVGVTVGEISVDQTLTPGGMYGLPAITVVNTGEALTEYTVALKTVSSQTTLSPDPGWFAFEPATFALKPRARRQVGITLSIPETATAGDYFGLIAAQAVLRSKTPMTVPAAASKLTFSVAPKPTPTSNGTDWRTIALYVAVGVSIVLLILLLRWITRRFQVVRKN